jgi:hypothetical protein
MNWNLIVCFHQIDCGEDFPANKLLCEVVNVLNKLLVWDGPRVQITIVATGSLAVFFLANEVDGRSPGSIGTPSGGVSEHLLELGFRDSEAVRC